MTNDEIEKINNQFDVLNEAKKKSDVDPNLNISHELPQEKEEKQRAEKEAKAKALIEAMQLELKNYLDSQLQQIPTLINQNIQQAFQQIAPQLQQQPAPEGDQDQKLAAIGQLAPVIAQIFGKGGEPAGQSVSDQIVGMILNSHMKKMQMDIDSQYMNTYQQPVNPPQWQRENLPNNQSRLNIE